MAALRFPFRATAITDPSSGRRRPRHALAQRSIMPTNLQVNATKPRIQYRADGVRREFLFPFAIFSEADLEVYVDSQQLRSGYAITGVGTTNGGAATFAAAPKSGSTVTLRRRLVVQRTTDFQESGPFRARVLNDELDYLTAAVQQLEAEIERSLRLAPADGDAAVVLPGGGERAGRVLAFDGSGNVTLTSADGLGGSGPGWQTLDDVPEGIAAKRFTAADAAKLAAIDAGAEVNPPQVSLAEKALASEPAARSFSPRDLGDMIVIHAPVHQDAVASVHGRNGIVVAEPGDYTAEQIAETAERVVMTADERAKLHAVVAGAEPNPAAVSAAEMAAPGETTAIRSFSPRDIAELITAIGPASVLRIDGGTATTTFPASAA